MANLQLKSDNFTRTRPLCHIFNDLAHNEGGIRVRFLRNFGLVTWIISYFSTFCTLMNLSECST